VSSGLHRGAILGASYPLGDGTRVRLRLAASSDAPQIWALLSAQGRADAQLQAMRLTRFDPRTEVVVCANALVAGREALVGVGALTLGRGHSLAPDLLVVDPVAGAAVADLVAGAVLARAQMLARRRAGREQAASARTATARR
jgi:hypothetical protein